MPRYFFHVIDGRAVIDTEGTEYPDLQQARLAAVQTAGRIIELEGPEAWHNNAWRMSVADEAEPWSFPSTLPRICTDTRLTGTNRSPFLQGSRAAHRPESSQARTLAPPSASRL
jgi:hypothetical protein